MAGLFSLVLLSCAATQRIATERDQGALAEAAGSYWSYVRWSDGGRAAPFLSTMEQRQALGMFINAPPWRITGVQLLAVEVGARLDASERPLQREGRVSVRVEHLDAWGGRLEVEVVEQDWQKSAGKWQVAPGVWEAGRLWGPSIEE